MATEVLLNVANNRKIAPGYAVLAITDKMRKAKWAEIVGLMPEKTKRVRKVPQITKGVVNPFYATLKTRFPEIPEVGKPGAKVAWATNFEYHDTIMATNEFGHNRWKACADAWSTNLHKKILQASKDNALEQAFQTDIDSIVGLRTAVGKDNRGDVDLMDTWCWGSNEKKSYFPSRINFSSLEASELLDTVCVWENGKIVETRKKIIEFQKLRTSEFKTKEGKSQTVNRILKLKNGGQLDGVIRRGSHFTINGYPQVFTVSNEVNYDGPDVQIHADQPLPSQVDDTTVRFDDDGDPQTISEILDVNYLLEPRRNKRLGGYMLVDNPFFLANLEVRFDSLGKIIPLGNG